MARKQAQLTAARARVDQLAFQAEHHRRVLAVHGGNDEPRYQPPGAQEDEDDPSIRALVDDYRGEGRSEGPLADRMLASMKQRQRSAAPEEPAKPASAHRTATTQEPNRERQRTS